MDWKKDLRGKKITVMRIGLLGRGVGDAQFLAEQGAEVLVVDDAAQSVMQPSVDALSEYKNVRFKFGPYDPEDFVHTDYVLKGAGAPQDEPALVAARSAGVPIKMSASWFVELAGIKTVGVTGTRGKTTTTMMLYGIMRAAGMDVVLGGNIRGVSTLALLPKVSKDTIALMELDSWQCQGWGEVKMSPNVAVFTTFMADHMNYYKNDMQAYLLDKAQIFLYQKPEDTFVVSDQVLPQLDAFKHGARAHVRVARTGNLELSVPGAHNQLNAACALEAARALGIDDAISLKALKEFKGVPGRLELVRDWNGIKIYNDTTATTPDALLVALAALGGSRTIVIAGGTSKDVDVSRLPPELAKQKYVAYLAGSGTDELGITNAHQSLRAALDDALAHAVEGDTVVLSPGFSSKGMFKNEYDRGDQFNALVNAL